MPLVGSAILPHGALILDPSSRPEMDDELRRAAQALHDGCVAAARAVAAAQPDVLLLYTPHGLIAEGADLHIYTNSSASGTCEWMGGWAEQRVRVALDSAAAASLLDALKEVKTGRPEGAAKAVAGLTAFSGYDAPLRWGEAVPLSFLRAATAPGAAKVVVLSHGPASTAERCRVAESCFM